MHERHLSASQWAVNTWSQLSYMTKNLVPILTRWAFISYIHIHISLYCWKNYQSPVLHFLQFFSSKYRHRGFWRQVVNVTEMMREEPTRYCQLLPLTWDDFLVKYLPFTKLNMNQNLKSTILKCDWTPYHSVTVLYQLWRFCYRNWCR